MAARLMWRRWRNSTSQYILQREEQWCELYIIEQTDKQINMLLMNELSIEHHPCLVSKSISLLFGCSGSTPVMFQDSFSLFSLPRQYEVSSTSTSKPMPTEATPS